MEYHYQCKKTNTNKFTQYVAQYIQIENVSQFPYDIENDNTNKNIDCHCSFDQPVGVEKQKCNQQNIDNIDKVNVKKIYFIQEDCFCKIIKLLQGLQ